jgi:DNA polymerase-4
VPPATELTILHVDLDAFYASVEQLADPTLQGRPVIVGGLGRRGVVAAASYEARRYGVHSAMPMGRARRACPDGVFLAPRFDAYGEASTSVMAILRDVTPLVEPLALDEAFLDVSGARRLHGSAPEIARAIRQRVKAETGLVASVGVATTKFVAKLASDLAKPDGMLVVEVGTELDFLHPLEVRKLWGVGPKTGERLAQLLPEETLVHALGEAHGRHLYALAWNRDERGVEPERAVKSVGHEETFPTDITDRETLAREVLRMSDRVAERLRDGRRAGRTVQLKLRYKDFRTITRSRTLPEPTNLAADIAAVARALLDAVELGEGVRLLGVAVQQLQDVDLGDSAGAQDQLPLDVDPGAARGTDARRRAVEDSMDAVRKRFGDDAVGPATLIDRTAHSEPERGARS